MNDLPKQLGMEDFLYFVKVNVPDGRFAKMGIYKEDDKMIYFVFLQGSDKSVKIGSLTRTSKEIFQKQLESGICEVSKTL